MTISRQDKLIFVRRHEQIKSKKEIYFSLKHVPGGYLAHAAMSVQPEQTKNFCRRNEPFICCWDLTDLVLATQS